MSSSDQAQTLQQLQQQVAEQTRKISALHEILESVSATAELPVVLNKSLKAALVAAKGQAGFIHLREKSGKTMRLVARHNIPDSIAENIAIVSSLDGLVAWVARNGQSIFIPNMAEDPRTVYLSASRTMQVYVGVPISRGQRVWGTLSIIGRVPSQFSDDEVNLLTSVGEEIGLVVENARLRRQAERLLVVQERNRLARELHDSVTQSLYSVTLFAEAGRRTALAADDEESVEYFAQIGKTGQQALKEMRLLIYKLRPSILSKEGLARALQQRLNSVEGRAGVKGRLIVEGEAKLSPLLEDALYQIAQEALNNALKHAMASEVIVHLDIMDSSQVVISIEDNGRGFDLETAVQSDGMGLTSMQERVESYGGTLSIQSQLGQGTTVEARLDHPITRPGQRTDFDVEDLP
ncbi:MAG: histidine kinase [Candidatus Promineifilaceae bacterium]